MSDVPHAPPDLLRLPGYGGAALMLRSRWVAQGWNDAPGGLVLDVGLLDPLRHVQHLARRCSTQVLDRLAAFLLAAARHEHPEQSLAHFSDSGLGMVLSAVQSTALTVDLEVSVVQDPEADAAEHHELGFGTSRAVLVSAALHSPGLAYAPVFDREL